MSDTKTEAKKIREALKKQGISSRQVSVQYDFYSLGSCIRVEIKDPALEMAPIAKLAQEAESVRRCEITGEILSGGNRYVKCNYSYEATQAREANIRDAVEKAVDSISETDFHETIRCSEYTVSRDANGMLHLWDATRHLSDGWKTSDLVRSLARKIQF